MNEKLFTKANGLAYKNKQVIIILKSFMFNGADGNKKWLNILQCCP